MPEALAGNEEDGHIQGSELLDLPTQEVPRHTLDNAFKEAGDSD